ncbi:MAG: hypothetical protein AABW64_03560 [Nanoarchaeota archaeon]
MNYILLILAIIVASISMVLITYLAITRKQLNKFFDEHTISK